MPAPSLPKWATIHKQADATANTATTVKSEYLMRLRSALQWQNRIQQAQRQAWNVVVDPIIHANKDLLVLKQQEKEKEEPPLKRSRVEPPPPQQKEDTAPATDPDIAIFTSQPSNNYPLELLPCLRISPPPICRLDRHALAEALWMQIPSRCCKVMIPHFLDSLHSTFALILRQCLQQETSPSLRQETRKLLKKNKRATSLQQSLLWWASQTQQFNSLVIVLEVSTTLSEVQSSIVELVRSCFLTPLQDPGGFSERLIRQDFYQLLQEWRSAYGVPVSLIVVGTTHSEQEDTMQWCGGMRLRHMFCRNDWFDAFWKQLGVLPISSRDQKQLLEAYQNDHQSTAKFCQNLQFYLTRFFLSKGSFAWDALIDHPPFVAWFSTYDNAKTLLEIDDESSVQLSRYKACLCLQLEHLPIFWKLHNTLFPWILHDQKTPVDWKKLLADIADMHTEIIQVLKEAKEEHQNESSKEGESGDIDKNNNEAGFIKSQHSSRLLLQHYLDCTNQNSQNNNTRLKGSAAKDTVGAIIPLKDLLSTVHTSVQELVVVVGTTIDNVDGPPSTAIRQDGIFKMLQDLNSLVGEQTDRCARQWKEQNPMYSSLQTISKDKIVPRMDLVDNLPQIAQRLYRVLQDRLSISREEWFQSLHLSVEEFSFGVWTLILCGLVQLKTNRKRGADLVSYEKVSVVWCQ